MENLPEGQAGASGVRKLVELGWAPAVTVLYAVWSVATSRPLDVALLGSLAVLSATAIVYARKLHQAEEARPEPVVRIQPAPAPAQAPAPLPQASVPVAKVEPKPAPAPPVEPAPAQRVEPPPVVVETKPAPMPEPTPQPVKAKTAVAETKSSAARVAVAEKPAEATAGAKKNAVAETQSAEQNRRAAERLEVVYAITSLKERARAMRRQWPDAVFCQRPLRAEWWTPAPNQTINAPWMGKAGEWYSQFKEARAKYFSSAPGEAYLQSLDLEEVIDLLDDVILSRETKPLHREMNVTAAKAPLVVIQSWGAPEGEDEKCGLWITNKSEIPASNIQLARAPIGGRYLSIFLPPSQSLAKDQKVFAIASLSGPQRTTAYHLEDVLRKLPVNGINGSKPLGIALRLIYDGKDGTRYASRHELSLDDSGVIKITYINTELLSMPVS